MKQYSLLSDTTQEVLFENAIHNNLSVASALFLCDVAPLLKEQQSMSAKQMAQICNAAPNTASYHLKRLVEKGYICRLNRFSWRLSDQALIVLNQPACQQHGLFMDALLSNMGISTAQFLEKIIPHLSEAELSGKKLSKKLNMGNIGVLTHLKRLSLKGYVVKTSSRSWKLGERTLHIQMGFTKINESSMF